MSGPTRSAFAGRYRMPLMLAVMAMTLCVTSGVARADDDGHGGFFGFDGGFFGLGNPFFGSLRFDDQTNAIVAIVFAVVQLVLAIISLSRGASD